jgi:hypothetical protein
MKTPQQSGYPTSENLLKISKEIIEASIEKGKYTFKKEQVHFSEALRAWLAEYGWQIKYNEGDFREGEPGYYEILPK